MSTFRDSNAQMAIELLIFVIMLPFTVPLIHDMVDRSWPGKGYLGMLNAFWVVGLAYGVTIGLITDKSVMNASFGYGAAGLALMVLGHISVLSGEVQARKIQRFLAAEKERAQSQDISPASGELKPARQPTSDDAGD